MRIEHEITGTSGCFFIEESGMRVAELKFDIRGEVIDAHHTEVDKNREGQGIAGALFDYLIQFALINEFQIIPTCPYILSKFKRNRSQLLALWYQPEYED